MSSSAQKTHPVYEGPVDVVAGEGSMLGADAVLVEVDGYWGGFLTMRSVAGAEIVQGTRLLQQRYLMIDGRAPAAFTSRRTDGDSPVLRIAGQGRAPFGRRIVRR